MTPPKPTTSHVLSKYWLRLILTISAAAGALSLVLVAALIFMIYLGIAFECGGIGGVVGVVHK